MRTVLAVDLGGTKTAVAHVDARGEMQGHSTTPSARTLEETVDQIAAASRGLDAVGIIVPGIYTASTGRAWCPNLWGPEDVPLLAAMRERVRVPVTIDSDRTGHVLGEAWLGAARGLAHVVFVAIGTGIGVGILTDGVVVRGAHGIAGAAGWFALTAEWSDAYAVSGCWEHQAAGPAVARASGFADARAAVDAARAGDQAALHVLRRAALFTGMGVANLISAVNPEIVVLGGGFMAGAGDLLIDTIRAEARRWAQPISAAKCRIELSQLGEHAGLIGAARLALDGL